MGCGTSKGDNPPKNKVQPKDGKNKKNQKGNDKNKKETQHKNNKTPRNNNNKKDDDDDGSVPDIVRGYPAPSPPKWKKKEVFKLEEMKAADKNAIQAEVDADTTFEELGSRLTNGLKTDLEKLRAVFMWMGLQDIGGQKYPNNVSEKKPLGAMKLLSQKKLSESTFFAQLCRGAKLPCVVVRGHVKGVSYEIGNDSTGYSSWNAVYVDGSWQIIHPLWSFSGVSGHDTGKWTQIESEGKGTRQKGKANQGVNVRHIIQTYFLPNPDEFIYLCMADKPEWQLVRNPWDREKFLNVPNFNMDYFTSDYKLKSENKGILSSEKGMIEMEFEERENSKSQLSYKLFFDEDNSEEKLPSDVDLPRTVFYETNGNQLRLVIRFHVVGIYKLDIVSSTSGQLGSFRLDAKEKSDNDDMFPANPPVGFGFGHTAKDSGLDNPSHTGGLVVIQKNKKETFKFKLKKKTTIISKLRHNEIDPKDLEKFLEQKVDGKNVTLEVKIPEDAEEGDFALQVYKESESEENNVLNYLLTNKKEGFESSKGQVRKRIRGERARMHLRLALDDEDMGYLERSIAAFEREKLKDTDGDLKKARQKLAKMKKERKGKMEVAELKRNLRKAMKEKNLDDLEASIEEAEESGHPELYTLIDKAKELANELETKEVEKEDEKYLRNLLKKAIEEKKKESLEEAIAEYDAIWMKHKVEEEEDEPWKKTPRKKKKKPSALDKEYSRARELLVELYEDDVEEAISENDCFGIQTVLDDSERSIVSRELAQSEVMERARRYLQQEKRLRRYLSPILALKKTTVAEINTYRDPMPVTHDVMKATLITLGDQPREVANWKDIQRYLNPSGGILSRIKRFKIDMLRYRSANRAERLLINYTTNDVREASAGVAAFYQWSNNMIEEAKENGSEADDDEKDRKEKEDRYGDKRSENGSKGGKGNNKNSKGPKKGQNSKGKQKNEKSNAKGKKSERKKDEEEDEEDKKGDKSDLDDKDKNEEKTPRKKGDRKKDEDEKDKDRKGDKSARDEDTTDGKTPRKKGDKNKDEDDKDQDKKGDKSARDEKNTKVGKSPRKEEKTPRKRDESPRKDDKEKNDDKPSKDDKEKPKVTKEKTVNRGNKGEEDDKDKKEEKGKKYSQDEKGRKYEKDAKNEKGKKDDRYTKEEKGKKDDRYTKDEKGKKDDRYTKEEKGKKDDRYTKDEKGKKDDRYTKEEKGKKDDRYTKEEKGKKDDRYTKEEKGKKDDRYTKDEKGKKDDRYTKEEKGKKDDRYTKDDKDKKDDKTRKTGKGKKEEPERDKKDGKTRDPDKDKKAGRDKR